jgi:hypothetical protein
LFTFNMFNIFSLHNLGSRVFLTNTPSVPNYLSIWMGVQFLRDLQGIYKNAQLVPYVDLNELSNELLYT